MLPAVKASSTLLYKSRSAGAGAYRPIFLESAKSAVVVPLNTEDAVLGDFFDVALKAKLGEQPNYIQPYWLQDENYNPYELFYGAIQFIDDHNQPLPSTILPPEGEVEKYIHKVIANRERLSLASQLKLSLEITNGNLVGAANLCFIASRLLARGSDLRAYPGLNITPEDLAEWNKHICQFETYDNKNTCDGPGDTYYFWTHLFIALLCASTDDIRFTVIQHTLSKATKLMLLIRNKIVKQPTVTSHTEASEIGRNVGLAIAEFLKD